jgi:hypothetical protein
LRQGLAPSFVLHLGLFHGLSGSLDQKLPKVYYSHRQRQKEHKCTNSVTQDPFVYIQLAKACHIAKSRTKKGKIHLDTMSCGKDKDI